MHSPPPSTLLTAPTDPDPPPPYPSHRARPSARHERVPSTAESEDAGYNWTLVGPENPNVNESTPLLAPDSPSSYRHPSARPRTTSHASSTRPPSLAQTVYTLFHSDSESDEPNLDDDGGDDDDPPAYPQHPTDPDSPAPSVVSRRRRSWKRYWRPLARRRYWLSLAHLLLVNFPFALLAWVYLFVFTLTGTTLLMALPLGAVLCFLDLLGARFFSRVELTLQTTFHTPLPYPTPAPPPIFTRLRAPSPSSDPESQFFLPPVPERSFYKNTYAMFTDPTTYRALTYFLLLKPSLTLLTTLLFLVLFPLSLALVFPLPLVLRIARGIGVWQAGVALEGLVGIF